jgi:hypothetical protein
MFASIASLVVWFVEAPAGRFAIVTVWILFASVFSWAAQRQLGRWVWMAPLAGLTLVLPIAAFALLHYLQISGEERVRILILFAFAASWLILLGFFGTGKPGHLAALCISLAFYQYGERSVEYFLSKDYSNLRAMLWIDIYQLKRPWPPAPTSLRQTRSGLTIYETILPTYETPLPNT